MTDLDQYLEGLTNQVCADLARMCPSEQQPSEYGLVFPSKRDGTVRISEQEAKLLFVQHLTVDKRVCFSWKRRQPRHTSRRARRRSALASI